MFIWPSLMIIKWYKEFSSIKRDKYLMAVKSSWLFTQIFQGFNHWLDFLICLRSKKCKNLQKICKKCSKTEEIKKKSNIHITLSLCSNGYITVLTSLILSELIFNYANLVSFFPLKFKIMVSCYQDAKFYM